MIKKPAYFIFSALLATAPTMAGIDVGYEADNETMVATGVSARWITDRIRVGYVGSTNRLSVINGASVSASIYSIVGESSYESELSDGVFARNNVIEVSGTGSLLSSGTLHVGIGSGSGRNKVLISNAGAVVSTTVNTGVYGGSGNRVEVVGVGTQWNITATDGWSESGLTVGYRASGNGLVFSNGASVVSASAHIGYSDGYVYDADQNQVLVSGGETRWDSGALIIGGIRASGNRVDIEEGASVDSGNVRISSRYAADSGNNGVVVSGNGSTWNVSGHLLMDATDEALGNEVRIESGGALFIQNGLHIQHDPEWDMHLSHLDLNAGGRLTIGTDFDASMSGFNYNAGSTLAVEGQLSGLSVLEADRRLETADLLGDLMIHGTFAPGHSPANSTVSGGLTLAADGTLEMELAGTDVGVEYDRLTVTDLAVLDGTLDLVLLDTFAPVFGDHFELFSWNGGVSNTFAKVSMPALIGDLQWDTHALYTTGTVTVIPEPSTVGLLSLSGLFLFLGRKRFKK